MIWVALVLAIAALALAAYLLWRETHRREIDRLLGDLSDSVDKLSIVLGLQLRPVLERLTKAVNEWAEEYAKKRDPP